MDTIDIKKVPRTEDSELSDTLRAVSSNSTNVVLRGNLASLLERKHDYAAAILQYEVLMGLDPDNRKGYQARIDQNLDFAMREMGFLEK